MSTDEALMADLERLIAFLRHEQKRPSSCTPDIVRRFDRAIRKHLDANNEPPLLVPDEPRQTFEWKPRPVSDPYVRSADL